MNSSNPGAAPPVTLEPTAPPPREVFRADRPSGLETTGASAAIDHAAELVTHVGAETPLTLGLFGAAGAGKSQAVERLLSRAQALAANAAGLGSGTPFLSRLVVARMSACEVEGEPATAIAASVHAALSADARAYGAFARSAAQLATDPLTASRAANRQLDETRRQLDSERRALEDLDARRARLGDTLLYDSAGSGVDAYARSNRTAIEARLRRFGFTGDAIANYKDLVRDVGENHGFAGRVQVFFRSLWMFPGQARLIVWAIILFLLAWGAGVAQTTSAVWLPSLRGLSEQMQPVADWLAGHLDWFSVLRQAAIVIACLCLLTNLWRAVRFVGLLTRGARLLRGDVEIRRRDLDGQIAHQTRRVDALASDMDAHARSAAEAEQRASLSAQAGPGGTPDQFLTQIAADSGSRPARAFLDAVEASMSQGASQAPQRIFVVLDDLDGLPPERAAAFLETAHRLLARRGFVSLICVDAGHLAKGWSGAAVAAQHLQRLVQIPLSITMPGGDEALQTYARGLLAGAPKTAPVPKVDASRSVLDQAMPAGEADFIASLAPLAGSTPRAVKRFVNIYRLARARSGDFASLALMLALDSGGAAGELAAMGAAMDVENPEQELVIHPGEPRLAAALASLNVARGKPLNVAEARAAWVLASDYRSPL